MDQLLADREAEPGSAEVTGCGAIGLSKVFENGGLPVFRYANACVLHLEGDAVGRAGLWSNANSNHDFALMGEFYGVTHEIIEDLLNPAWIAFQDRDHLWQGNSKLQALLKTVGGPERADLLYEMTQIE